MDRDSNVTVEGQTTPYRFEPTYLGVKLYRTIKFRRHLQSLRRNVLDSRCDSQDQSGEQLQNPSAQ